MDGLIEKMSSAQILAAIAILVGGLVALTMILSITRYQLRSLEDDTALKREQQQGELALRNRLVEQGVVKDEKSLDALLTATHPVPDELDTGLATRFGMLSLDAEEIESTLQLAMTADPTRKQAIISVMDELLEYAAEPEAILAAIRPLCPSPASAGC
jgi:hypothetical protein